MIITQHAKFCCFDDNLPTRFHETIETHMIEHKSKSLITQDTTKLDNLHHLGSEAPHIPDFTLNMNQIFQA